MLVSLAFTLPYFTVRSNGQAVKLIAGGGRDASNALTLIKMLIALLQTCSSRLMAIPEFLT
jgi:hypothetical protein